MPRRSSWLKRYLKAEIGVAETPGAIYKTTLWVLLCLLNMKLCAIPQPIMHFITKYFNDPDKCYCKMLHANVLNPSNPVLVQAKMNHLNITALFANQTAKIAFRDVLI